MSTALVTGATSGIGLGFTRRLASDGHDIIVVARDRDRLTAVAEEIRSTGVGCEIVGADLSDRAQVDEVAARLADRSAPVDVLVNNAGFAIGQRFVGGDIERQQAAIDVMVTAVMRLCHAGVPGMVERGHGAVVNVSSIASFLPYGAYSAAKAWVTTFTEGLATELGGTGVRALALCPGFVRTEFHERAGIDHDRSSNTWWLEVDGVVDTALKDLRRGKVISVPSLQYKTIAWGARLLPLDAHRRADQIRRARLAGRGQSRNS
jgi:short-subunit dehydrogenase